MRRIALFIAALMGLGTVAHAQQYQMDVETADGLFTSYLVSDMQAVACEDGKTIITLDNNSKKTYDNSEIKSLSWSEYKGSSTAASGSYRIDEEHLGVVTPDYSVEFSPLTVDKEMTLTVTKSSGTPALLPEGMKTVVAYDFKLGDKHELDGVAVIRLPMNVSEGTSPMAAYYNEAEGKWQTVNGTYDKTTGEMVIKTTHLSTYAGIEVVNALTRFARISYFWMPDFEEVNKLAVQLQKFIYSDNPDAAAVETFCGQYSEATQLGIDIGFNALTACGFESEALSGFSDLLGHLGVALSIYQICRNDYSGDEAQLAGNTMKLCLQQALGWATKFCGNAVLTASMCCVAGIDYCLNKFATEAWSNRKDFYRKAMDDYYRKGGKGYRSAVDWYKILTQILKRTDLSVEKIHELVDQEVTAYSNKVWNDAEYLTWYEAEHGVKFGWNAGTVVCKDLAAEKRGELYNGVLVSVFRNIKNHYEQKSFDIAWDAMGKYVEELNRVVTLQFVDSSLVDDKAESAYKGYTVRFKDLPKTVSNPQEWECTLDARGEAKLQYRVIAAADPEIKGVVELVAPDGKVANEIKLKGVKLSEGNREVKTYVNIAPSQIKPSVEPILLEFPAEGGIKVAKYYYGDYKYLGKQSSASWMTTAWSDDNNKYPDEVIVCVGPNTTKEARQDTIKMGFTTVKGSPFNERFIIPIVVKQAVGPYNLKDAKSYLVGSWRYKERVGGSYDVDKDYLLTFKSDGTYTEDRKEDSPNYDYHSHGSEEGTYEVTEITHSDSNRIKLKVKMTYKSGSREAQIDIYAHRIFYWQPRLHYYDRE